MLLFVLAGLVLLVLVVVTLLAPSLASLYTLVDEDELVVAPF